jgi:DNA-binding transcriptional ArsR family regulator
MRTASPTDTSTRVEVSARDDRRMHETEPRRGDADIATVAALFADPARARVLMALTDGRALPASMLAAEAGVSAPTMSAHLARLRAAGLISVETSGRHRYHRLAGDAVAGVLEALASVAPAQPVRSLRQGTRAAAVRSARSCYDHLAGRLGVTITGCLIERGALVSTDGVDDGSRRPTDPLASRLAAHPYRLGPAARDTLAAVGIELDVLTSAGSRRPLLRFCVDWSEQRHHLAGRLGAAMLGRMLDAGWVKRADRSRAIRLTERGAEELTERLGLPESW